MKFINSKRFRVIVQLTVAISLILFITFSYFNQRKDYNIIKKNQNFVDGVIVDYGVSGKSSRFVKYKYVVNGKEYEGRISPSDNLICEKSGYSDCIGKKYTVIYSVDFPEKSYMLAEKYGYELFDLEVPYEYK